MCVDGTVYMGLPLCLLPLHLYTNQLDGLRMFIVPICDESLVLGMYIGVSKVVVVKCCHIARSHHLCRSTESSPFSAFKIQRRGL